MPYDKEALNKSKEQGILESHLDASVLSMDEADRNQLHAEMNSAQNDLHQPPPPAAVTQAVIPGQHRRKPRGLFNKIVDFLKRIFLGKEAIKYLNQQKELRTIKMVLTNFGGGFYNFEDDLLTELFPSYMFRIYLPLFMLHMLFEEVMAPDETLNLEQTNFFLEFMYGLLSDETKKVMKGFSREKLAELYENSEDAEATIREGLEEFENYLYKNDRENILVHSEVFEKLLQIYQQDFKFIFKVFSTDFDFDIHNRPSFHPGNTGTTGLLIDRLRDLNSHLYLANGLQVPENVFYHFTETLSQVKERIAKEQERIENDLESLLDEDDASSEASLKPTINPKYTSIDLTSPVLQELLSDIQNLNKSKAVDYIVRYYTQHYDYTTKKAPFSPYFYNRYVEMIRYRIEHTFTLIHKEITADKIIKQICDFFEMPTLNGLMYVQNYDEPMNIRFAKKQLPLYSQVMKTALLKTYFHKKFTETKKNLDMIMVEADFVDRPRGKDFSEEYASFLRTMEELQSFEKELADNKDTQKGMMRFISGVWGDKQYRNTITNKIRDIDDHARIITGQAYENLSKVREYIEECLADLRTPTPSLLGNAKTIGGVQHKTMIAQLFRNVEEMKRFLTLFAAVNENEMMFI